MNHHRRTVNPARRRGGIISVKCNFPSYQILACPTPHRFTFWNFHLRLAWTTLSGHPPWTSSAPLPGQNLLDPKPQPILLLHHHFSDLVLCPVLSVVPAHYIPLENQSVTPSRPGNLQIHSFIHPSILHSAFCIHSHDQLRPTTFIFNSSKESQVQLCCPIHKANVFAFHEYTYTQAFSKKVNRPPHPSVVALTLSIVDTKSICVPQLSSPCSVVLP